jgi:hypothetical protein
MSSNMRRGCIHIDRRVSCGPRGTEGIRLNKCQVLHEKIGAGKMAQTFLWWVIVLEVRLDGFVLFVK